MRRQKKKEGEKNPKIKKRIWLEEEKKKLPPLLSGENPHPPQKWNSKRRDREGKRSKGGDAGRVGGTFVRLERGDLVRRRQKGKGRDEDPTRIISAPHITRNVSVGRQV